jgi:hypothetical protein
VSKYYKTDARYSNVSVTYTSAQVDGLLTAYYTSAQVDALTWDFSAITGTPTTLSGYGITDAASSSQGTLADSAVQPGDNVSVLTNDAGYLDATTGVEPGDNISTLTNDSGYITEYAPPTVRDEATDPYTLVLADANSVIRLTATDADVTIPQESSVNFPVGTEISIRFASTGTQTVTTTGLTINGSIPSLAQHVEFKLRKVGSDEWDVV